MAALAECLAALACRNLFSLISQFEVQSNRVSERNLPPKSHAVVCYLETKSMNIRTLVSVLASVALVGIICVSAVAQNRATVRGQVSDEFGASIVGVTVTVTGSNGVGKTV